MLLKKKKKKNPHTLNLGQRNLLGANHISQQESLQHQVWHLSDGPKNCQIGSLCKKERKEGRHEEGVNEEIKERKVCLCCNQMGPTLVGTGGVQSAVAWLAQTSDVCSSDRPLVTLRKACYLHQSATQAYLVLSWVYVLKTKTLRFMFWFITGKNAVSG